jgi:2-keto-3-deoxy-L-rhamnonate aldolase RhmA
VIVPRVPNADTARAVVEACHFAPEGRRAPTASNSVTRYAPISPGAAMQAIASRTIVGVMVESAEGLAHADAICATPGVDLVLIGAFDLSSDLGIFGEFGHPTFREAVTRVAAACARHGLVLGLAGVSDAALIGHYVAAGVRYLGVGTETALFMEAARGRTTALRAISLH